ncbi:ABC transporter (ATP-binding protein) [Agrobacterium sp. ATCC 31749]|nr:ABC transporter (ATP-binding protein) [Agrobacterium sp. ATCC 31749]
MLLPQPLGPTSVTNFPLSIDKSISLSATMLSPERVMNDLDALSMRMYECDDCISFPFLYL